MAVAGSLRSRDELSIALGNVARRWPRLGSRDGGACGESATLRASLPPGFGAGHLTPTLRLTQSIPVTGGLPGRNAQESSQHQGQHLLVGRATEDGESDCGSTTIRGMASPASPGNFFAA